MPTPPAAPAPACCSTTGAAKAASGATAFPATRRSSCCASAITEKIEIVRQLIQAHSYWRMKGLTVDLVILNEDVSVYRQSLHDQITSLIASGIEAQMLDKPGGIFVRRLEQIPNDDRVLLQSVARIVLDDENGTLARATRTAQRAGTAGPGPDAHPLRADRFARSRCRRAS